MADLVITATDVISAASAGFGSGTAGASITAGQWLYKDASDGGKLKLAHAETSESTAQVVGVALHAAGTGQPIRYQVSGDLDCGGTTVVGTVYVLSASGGIAPAADLLSNDWVTVLGVGTSATNLKMQIVISGVQVP